MKGQYKVILTLILTLIITLTLSISGQYMVVIYEGIFKHGSY